MPLIMSDDKKACTSEPTTDNSVFVVGIEEWNTEERCTARLEQLERSVPNIWESFFVLPRIGMIYENLDMDLINRDLGWGGNPALNLTLIVADYHAKDEAGRSLIDVGREAGVSSDSIERLRYSVFAKVRHCSIDVSKLDQNGSHYSKEGDFDFDIDCDGRLVAFNLDKFPPTRERNELGSYTIHFDESKQPDLLAEKLSPKIRIRTAGIADRVTELLFEQRRKIDSGQEPEEPRSL